MTENLPILRTLSADEDREVGISAAVTLFLLKEPNAARLITNALKSDDDWIVRRTLKELKRVTTAELLFELADGLRVTAGNAALSPGSRAEAQGLLKQLGTTR